MRERVKLIRCPLRSRLLKRLQVAAKIVGSVDLTPCYAYKSPLWCGIVGIALQGSGVWLSP
jgi:hypothetical protein